MQRIIERLDSLDEEYIASGRSALYNKVAGVVVTGSEDGALSTIGSIQMVLTFMGFTLPPECAAYWVGEVGQPTSQEEHGHDAHGQEPGPEPRLSRAAAEGASEDFTAGEGRLLRSARRPRGARPRLRRRLSRHRRADSQWIGWQRSWTQLRGLDRGPRAQAQRIGKPHCPRSPSTATMATGAPFPRRPAVQTDAAPPTPSRSSGRPFSIPRDLPLLGHDRTRHEPGRTEGALRSNRLQRVCSVRR